ncbi:uncharacterized protein K02A2.6-like isoform X1 [Lutzomyia longipalpis]|uniref:uncharacterized protein K02A2.6-like isoform X1 n=2 Tax=Lutzomyia longipalpis TaxID=7200 RepID=UPI002483EBC1|nr:uncharacterized protein K02A2.6-like isoform X1 [Lutzomyia longipalpis]XP_055693786.1 uncharacterized protein K02A2.6-like isoform X1 [Lutzomyia longipalpis]
MIFFSSFTEIDKEKIMDHGNQYNVPPFKRSLLSPNENRKNWETFKRGFLSVALATAETDKKKLKGMLLAYGGPDLREVFYQIPGADIPGDDDNDPYKIALKKLDEHFAPKRHDSYERQMFWSLMPEPEESLEQVILRAMHQAEKCVFESEKCDAKTSAKIDKIIMLCPEELKQKIMAKPNYDLDVLLQYIHAYQAAKAQAKEMSKQSSTIGEGSGSNLEKSDLNAVQEKKQKYGGRPKAQAGHFNTKDECSRCGRSGHTAKDPNCPAMEKTCAKCNIKGHFARKCRTRRAQNLKRSNAEDASTPKSKIAKVNHVSEENDSEEEDGNDGFIFNVGDGDEYIWCKVGGILIEMLIDSGSTHNIIGENTWKYLKKSGIFAQNMTKSVTKQLKAYAQSSPLEILGSFEAEVVIQDVNGELKSTATFYVVKGGSQPLLGKATAKALGVLMLGLPSKQHSGICAVQAQQGSKPFPKIRGISLMIPIDEDVTPVNQHARRPPIALLSKVEEKLDELLKADIIEPVEGPSDWVSPVVVLPKDNGDIRLCIDMRQANKAVRRENHIMPTFEDFLPQLTKAKFFSRLDVKNAFHQIELNPACRKITTFITHKGMFRYEE